jgi:hypothetical protein
MLTFARFRYPAPGAARRFPVFGSHRAAALWGCPGCCGTLHPEDAVSEYAPRNGQFRLTCRACQHSLFYDVEVEEVPR